MTVTVSSNKKFYSAQVHINANASIVVAGAAGVSNVAIDTEVITGGTISQALWGIDSGSIQVKRNGALVAVYTGTGTINYAAQSLPLSVGQASNVDVTFVGSANGYLVLEIQKIVPPTGSDYFKG